MAIDPKTGRVMAYFGGDNGTGTDYAGLNTNPKTGALEGGHPPGSSFKIYTLAAALDNNISLESHWDAKPFKAPGISAQIRNAGGNASCGSYCTLRQSVVKSYNVPFYHITEALPPGAVVDMAKNAGIRTMWDNEKGEAHDLTQAKGEELHPGVFFHVLGYGAYPITVLDHANGLATIANRGMYNKAHFVLSVEKKDSETGKWRLVGGEDLDPRQTIRPEVADDVNDVLQEIPRNNGDSLDGRPATGKTGTWELNEKSADNAHAWMIGATPQLATAIWVGNVGKQVALIDDNGEQGPGFRPTGRDLEAVHGQGPRRQGRRAVPRRQGHRQPGHRQRQVAGADGAAVRADRPASACSATGATTTAAGTTTGATTTAAAVTTTTTTRCSAVPGALPHSYRHRPVDRSSTTRRPHQTVWAPLPYVGPASERRTHAPK